MKAEVEYMTHTITQAAQLKSTLEKYDINPQNSTIVSIDAVQYYPSIKFSLIQKAVQYFSQGLPQDKQILIEKCLGMIQTFHGK